LKFAGPLAADRVEDRRVLQADGDEDVFGEDERAITRRELSRMLRCVSCQRLLPKASGQGRVAAYGVLVPDEEMRTAIAEGRDLLARRTPFPDGCISMAAEIRRMADDGTVSHQTASDYLAGL
jgi:twitching motility protein PilT